MNDENSTSDQLSPITPALRGDNPELITAVELNQWADRAHAKQVFPELMRRLLANTPGVTNIDIRSHEGTAAPGWDGIATSKGSSFLPQGELRFEFGTNKNPKSKAQKDYSKRRENPRNNEHTFIFATPRNWPGGQSWQEERKSDNHFADVKVIDAYTLEAWLKETPSIHYWISERLRRSPQMVSTLENWWNSLEGKLEEKIPSEFFSSGRLRECNQLLNYLSLENKENNYITIISRSKDDILAFIYAALKDNPAYLNRALIIKDKNTWEHVINTKQNLILIPLFNELDSTNLELYRHKIIVATDGKFITNKNTVVELSKINKGSSTEVLRKGGFSYEESHRLTGLAHRDINAFFRVLSNTIVKKPDWLQDPETVAVIAPLILVGSWENQKEDTQLIQDITEKSTQEIDRLLTRFSNSSNSPFIQSGDTWKLTNALEIAKWVLPDLEYSARTNWQDFISTILFSSKYTGTLQHHAAKGLILASVATENLSEDRKLKYYVDQVVNDLLNKSIENSEKDLFNKLSKFFPELAEASPEIFINFFELYLKQPFQVAENIFRDRSQGYLGTSSPHVNLLWALEKLCWIPSYYTRAVGLLSRLASIDPGGSLQSNRPLDSLEKVLSGYLSESAATSDDKIFNIKKTLKKDPVTGWKILMRLWPENPPRAILIDRHTPLYRDIHKSQITDTNIETYLNDLVTITIENTGYQMDRWIEILPKINALPTPRQTQIIHKLAELVSENIWDSEEIYNLWKTLDTIITEHEKFSSAEWAIQLAEINKLKDISQKLLQEDDFRHNIKFFKHETPILNGLKDGDPTYTEVLREFQINVLRDILDKNLTDLNFLIQEADFPDTIGSCLAQIPESPEQHILTWLNSDSRHYQKAAFAFARTKINDCGTEWLNSIFSTLKIDQKTKSILITLVPFSKTHWDSMKYLEAELISSYLEKSIYQPMTNDNFEEEIDIFLLNGYYWRALEVLNYMIQTEQDPDFTYVNKSLLKFISSNFFFHRSQKTSLNVRNILSWLERKYPKYPYTSFIEFLFFDGSNYPSNALYQELVDNPIKFTILFKKAYPENNKLKSRCRLRAMNVLNSWSTLPGINEDGSIDKQYLNEWIFTVRSRLEGYVYSNIGNQYVGKILSCSPSGKDNIWPAEEVRDIIESLECPDIEEGILLGRLNQRGVTTRGIYTGGIQERELAQKYHTGAQRIAIHYPRTARILRNIAADLDWQAHRFDKGAERLSDEE
jgi:transcriptional regulator, XRE family